MASEWYRPSTISDVLPGAHQKILGTEPIKSDSKRKLIETSRFRDRPPVLTYEPLEAKIAKRSLWNHIGVTYKGVVKKASEEKALKVVHDLLYQVADYPLRSNNVVESLRDFRSSDLPSGEELERMRSHHAPVIEIGRFMGALALREGMPVVADSVHWYYKAASLSDFEFPEYLNNTISSHQYRIIFWRNELKSLEDHPAVNDLLETIRSSNEVEE